MARTTSTQRGASRRTTGSASGGSGSRGAAPSRSRKPASSPRARATAPSRSRSRKPAGPWLPLAVGALVIVLGWSLYPALRLEYQASRRLADRRQEYESIKQRNAEVRTQVAELKTPQGVEKAAREDLNYAKSGEHVYVVIPSDTATTAKAGSAGVSTASVTQTGDESLLRYILDALFGVEQPTATVEP